MHTYIHTHIHIWEPEKNLHDEDDHDGGARPEADVAAAPPLLHGLGGVEQDGEDGEGEDEVEEGDAHAAGAAAGLGAVLLGPAERQDAAPADRHVDGRQPARAPRRREVREPEDAAQGGHRVPAERHPAQVEQQLMLGRPPRRVRLGVYPHQRRRRHARRAQPEERDQRYVQRHAPSAPSAPVTPVAPATYPAAAAIAVVWL